MSLFDQVKKDVNGHFATLKRRMHLKAPILIAPDGQSVTWGSFRSMQLLYAAYPPEFGMTEPFLDRIALNFVRHQISIPVFGLLDIEPCVRGGDTIDSILLQPLKAAHEKLITTCLNGTPTPNEVPLVAQLQWTRRLAATFPWEGRLLSLMARQATIHDLIHGDGSRFATIPIPTGAIARNLTDNPDTEKIKQTIQRLLYGDAGNLWFDTGLPTKAAEDLRKVWSTRYRFASLRNTVASSHSPGPFVLAVFLEAFLDHFRQTQRMPRRFGKHLRIALEAHRTRPRAELLLNLGQVAYRLNLDRTAWYLLLKAARSLPTGSLRSILHYRYPQWLLSAFADLARKAGAIDVARQYQTWFEELVLAAPSSPAEARDWSALGIAPQ